MIKGTSLLICLVTIILGLAIYLQPASGEGLQINISQTWPSRTPTSSSEPVKSTTPGNSKPDTPKPDQPNPSTTSLPPDQQTTQDDGLIPTLTASNLALIPTALPCGLPPTVLALGSVSVRIGPSSEYPLLGRLAFSDVRIVVGRADSSPWWLIQFDELQQGWVSDQAVEVQGNASDTFVVASNSGNGDSILEEGLWIPTRQPQCVLIDSNGASSVGDFQAPGTATAESQALGTAIPPEVISGKPTPISAVTEEIAISAQSKDADQVVTPVVPTESSESAERSTGSLNWLPIAGLLLIVAGATILLLQSRRSANEKD